MAWIIPALAALLVTAANATPAAAAQRSDLRSPAMRAGTGASASATVSARIIRASARVGRGLGPPAPAMTPRRATVTAADGRAVAALVYDFE
jgi:hypothetical protein